MAIANYFYNQTTRKYVALFGTLFNQLKIERVTTDGSETQSMIVPLSYAPYQKILSRVQQDPDLLNSTKPAISLPRMSFEITSMLYDPSRKVASTRKVLKNNPGIESNSFIYSPVPYNIEFSLYIMTKYSEDAVKIVEQIVPFFTPDWTVSARMLPDMDPLDIPVVLNSVTTDELYEGSYEERPTILYTLTFTLRGWYFGPEREKKTIKFIETGFAASTSADAVEEEKVTIRPGLDAEGNPVTVDGVQATGVAILENGSVSSVKIVNDGQGYNEGTGVIIAPPDSATALITPNVVDTSISTFTIVESGGYYSTPPTITISAPDAPITTATASGTLSGDTLASVNVTNGGTYYNTATVSVAPPPNKATEVKFGTDALGHYSYNKSTLIGTSPQLVTAGTGYAFEFWIYPRQFSSDVLHVLHINGTSIQIEIEQPGNLAYRPALNAPPVRSTGTLFINQWNHCRIEDAQGTARWLLNGVVETGGVTPASFIPGTSGSDVIVGERSPSEKSFIGEIDNISFDQISTVTPTGTYTVPTAPTTGSYFTVDFDLDPATATATVVNGEVTEVTVTHAGSGYTAGAPAITISAPDGDAVDYQATATAALTDGAISSVNITDPGKFYVNPTATVDAPISTTATATVTIDAYNQIETIDITNPGAGYRTPPVVTIDGPDTVSIPYQQIEFGDDWGIITVIEDV